MKDKTVAIVGLGYVGLPLAIALAKKVHVFGFDIKESRIHELKNNVDSTGEIASSELQLSSLTFSYDQKDLKNHDIYIITVPTPVDKKNKPDLSPLKAATELVGQALKKGAVVVYESTVYPGVTEDICGPLLESISGLQCGKDFFLGYSPERINPGDKEHTIDRITKVVAGQNKAVTELLATLYGFINNDNIFRARNIKTAEASKVIENAQRDINIAFVNEIAVIFNKLGISIYDVLEASKTKWNFLPFTPGLVGGHCIGVDPYYLAECSKKLGHNPEVILSGRRTNDMMAHYIAHKINEEITEKLAYGKHANILVLGLTFKENVPDLRNTKVVDLVNSLTNCGHHVDVHDPLADSSEAKSFYNLDLISSEQLMCQETQSSLEAVGNTAKQLPTPPNQLYDCIITAVNHTFYTQWSSETYSNLLNKEGFIADIKNMCGNITLQPLQRIWRL